MIDREHDLSITKQTEVLRISRGSVYYLPRPVPDADLAIMRRLDRLHLEYPFAGSRMLRGLLALQGCKIGRRHVKTLMKRMGIEALYRRPRTTKPEPGHKIYPYLLRGMEITRPNQVWAMDITYIPMANSFVYLAVVLDGDSPGSVVAVVDHDGGGLLRRDPGRCFGPSRQAGDLQHRSGLTVHRCGLHRLARQPRVFRSWSLTGDSFSRFALISRSVHRRSIARSKI